MFKTFTFLTFITFIFKAYSLSTQNLGNKNIIIRGPTAPLESARLFSQNFIAKDIDITFLREAELKHGRLAMLASIIIPTLEKFTDGLGINQFQELPDIYQIGLISMMFVGEFGSMFRGWENPLQKPFKLKEDYQPGDFGFSLLKNDSKSGELMDKELNNGRLAMIAVLGMMAQELVTHQQLFN